MVDEIREELDLDELASQLPKPQDLLESQDDAPVIKLVNAILTQAVKAKASDIHIETFEEQVLVRYRIDGVLREVLTLPRALSPILISRLKVMARLDIAEKRLHKTVGSVYALLAIQLMFGFRHYPLIMVNALSCGYSIKSITSEYDSSRYVASMPNACRETS